MTSALLLDEMFDPRIALVLAEQGHDCLAVAADESLRGSSDSRLFDVTVQQGRALVTNNVADFERIRRDAQQRGDAVPPLVYTSDVTFPRDRRFVHRIVEALAQACDSDAILRSSGVLWLSPPS